MKLSILLFSLVAFLNSGCATTVSKSNGAWGAPYSGAECSFKDLATMPLGGPAQYPIVPALYLSDIPLSFVADTLILPADLLMFKQWRSVSCSPHKDEVN